MFQEIILQSENKIVCPKCKRFTEIPEDFKHFEHGFVGYFHCDHCEISPKIFKINDSSYETRVKIIVNRRNLDDTSRIQRYL